MRFSLRVNNDLDFSTLVALAVKAEEFGFDQLWVSHDLFWRSAPVLLAVVARETNRIGLGAGVMNPSSMAVTEIAMAAATLQEVSGGRFLLGIGSGAPEFLGWAGITPPPPLGSTRSAVAAIRLLLTGESPEGAPAAGRLRIPVAPTPIYIGAMGPRMLALAGEIGDGALPLLFPPERLRRVKEQLAGVPESFDLAACVWVSIDPDAARARRALAAKIAYYGSSFAPQLLKDAGLTVAEMQAVDGDPARVNERMLALGIAGDSQAVVERCKGLIALGASHLSFGPPLGPHPLSAVETLGREVLPALRGAEPRGL